MLLSINDLQIPISPPAQCVYMKTGEMGSEGEIKHSVAQQLHSLSKHSGSEGLIFLLAEWLRGVVRRLQSQVSR